MAENEVQLDLKKRARRRLVGAVALALLAAIVLPMVMDSEPRPEGNELSIRIPSQEGANYASRLISGAAPPPVKPALPADSVPPAETVSVPPPAKVAVASASSAASSSLAAAASVQKSSSSSSKPVEKPVRAEETRALEILEGRASASSASVQLFVQLGVYREEANAKEVAAKAAAAGIKVRLERQNGRTRVRSGPYAERAAADKLVARLKSAGLSGIVTNK